MDDTIKLALETIAQDKQAIIFCASRASAEKTAEDIAKKIHLANSEKIEKADEISLSCLKVVSPATKQCKRLAITLNKQIAFHHSGLHSKQKEIIETEFKNSNIKVICATPTLAAGLSLPVFRVICKSLKRFSGRFGMSWIPTLEYLQMAGRAGRPEFEQFGEAIAIAKNQNEKDEIYQRYILGQPEEIYSKLNVEPVLRIYLLSLISSGIINDTDQMSEFFAKTFWAHQFEDLDELEEIMRRMLTLLEDWGFITINDLMHKTKSSLQKSNRTYSQKTPPQVKNPKNKSQHSINQLFTSALEIISNKSQQLKNTSQQNVTSLSVTKIGRRISELYLDPLTANHIIQCLDKAQYRLDNQNSNAAKNIKNTSFSYLQMISNTLEMRPRLKIKSKEQEIYSNVLIEHYQELLQDEPKVFDLNYSDFMKSIKTAHFFQMWIDETAEDLLYEKMNIRPGEIRVKLEVANWLIYSCCELAKNLNYMNQLAPLQKLRIRVKSGVREELLPLLRLKGVGRYRARKLYSSGLKTISDLKRISQKDLSLTLGPMLASSIKDQLGQKVEPIKKSKRKGQLNLNKFS
jgi:helicase